MGTINDMIRKLERFQEELENLSDKKVSILPDANGMIDRECPKQECNSHFKVNSEDWKNIFKNEEVFCPLCRNNSPAEKYFPPEQRGQVVDNIRSAIMDYWNHSTPIYENIASVESKKEFELNIQCQYCHVRFSVIGTAYFCPCCGVSVVEKNIKQLIEKLILKANKIDSIQKSFEQHFTKDDAAIYTKSMLENSITQCIGMLQSFSESRYNSLSATKAPFNAFQNVDKANKLWAGLNGQGYDIWLTNQEKKVLLLYTQRRHLIEHKGGIVNSQYLQITNDSKYTVGDRIVVKADDVIILSEVVIKIVDSINNL